ncbi:MAG: CxxxxCH/CxxCH domain c-type cytochrome [Candidatus Kryptoniota bacterium]
MRIYLSILFMVLITVSLTGCSKLQQNILAPQPSQGDIHPAGWTDMNSPNFHGKFIKNNHYDLSTCATCHGNDFKGGTAGKSCYTCHQGINGPLSCNTCHGDSTGIAPPVDLSGNTGSESPGVGAHRVHLSGGFISSGVRCSSCHVVPQKAGPGIHPFGVPAIVAFSGLSTVATNTPSSQYYDSTQPTISPAPFFNSQTLSCSNTYCHGNFKNGNNFSPKWTGGHDQAACGTCHGIPPNNSVHKGQTIQTCFKCHYPTLKDSNGTMVDSTHINGKLNLYGHELTVW